MPRTSCSSTLPSAPAACKADEARPRSSDFGDVAFKLGQSERSTLIGDPASAKEPGHAAGWLVGGPKHAVDGVLILASDDLSWLDGEQKKLASELSAQGMKIEHEERGDVSTAPTRGHEQFGFKDDISPGCSWALADRPYDFVTKRTLPSDADSVPAGGLRHRQQSGPDIISAGPARPAPEHLDAATRPKARQGQERPSWCIAGVSMPTCSGSLSRTPPSGPSDLPQRARPTGPAGRLFDRQVEDGPPLAPAPTDIDYRDGLNCLHLRQEHPAPATRRQAADPDRLGAAGRYPKKVNPRDQATDLGISEHTPPRSILRRGITYAAKDGDKGLLFVAYQSSIADQFEFLMRMWANKEDTPRNNGGLDPILSQNPSRKFHLPIDGKVENIAIPKSFVEPTGGRYFFCAVHRFLQEHLAGGAKKPSRKTLSLSSYAIVPKKAKKTEMVHPESRQR
jgi:hypothetical protein